MWWCDFVPDVQHLKNKVRVKQAKRARVAHAAQARAKKRAAALGNLNDSIRTNFFSSVIIYIALKIPFHIGIFNSSLSKYGKIPTNHARIC